MSAPTIVGSYPDTVQGSPAAEAAEEKYKLKYAIGVCTALREYDPKAFQEMFGGDMNTCIRKAGAFADLNFDMWKVKWGPSLASRIASFQ
ncbi:MAG: hypothetical protein QXI42_11540 [Thermoproteota archaeon]